MNRQFGALLGSFSLGILLFGSVPNLHAQQQVVGKIKFGSTAPVSLTGGSSLRFLTATGLDFHPIGSANPGVNAIVNLGATGSFASLGFPTFAVFKDFNFAPLPLGGADVFEISGGAFSFHLNTVTVTRSVKSLFLSGTGVITGPGYAPTPAKFYFSTQTDSLTKTAYSFSANIEAIPEG